MPGPNPGGAGHGPIVVQSPRSIPAADFTISGGTVLQAIDGFGAATPFSTAYATGVADFLWGTGIGLSIVRAQLWVDTSSGIQGWPLYFSPMDSTGTSVKGDFSHELQAQTRGTKYILLSVWAPPNDLGPWPWLAGGAKNGALNTANYADMATAITSALSNALAAGVYVTHVSPANEPDITPSYAQTSWTPTQLVNFVKNNLGPALATWGAANPTWQTATGLSRPKLVVGETAAWSALATWIAAFEADSTALAFVDIYASHQYFGNGASAPPSPCSRPIWMTEVSGQGAADVTMTDALAQVAWIYDAINTGDASAWVYWFAEDVSDNNNGWVVGTPATNWTNPANSLADWNAPTTPKRAYAIGNFSKFVGPGSTRLSVGGSIAGVKSLSFKRADGKPVLVCINTNGSSVPFSVALSGFSTANVTPYITDATRNLAAQTAIGLSGGRFSSSLAAGSVTTFIGDA